MKTPKTTVLDYIDWRGDLSFEADPINEIDCFVFATLSYIDFSVAPFVNALDREIAPVLSRVYEAVDAYRGGDKKFLQLLSKCAMSERFKKVRVFSYDSIINEELGTQFAAVTFDTGKELVVTFRGTDDSIVGWEEDLKMSFSKIPAQDYAQQYANTIASKYPECDLYLCGHSKGGNLAIWAGAHIQDSSFSKLKMVYDYDGPGFCGDFTSEEGYLRILDRTVKYVVDSSVIGMFLDSRAQQQIIASKDIGTISQHYPMSWVVVGKKFFTLESRSSVAKLTDSLIDEWIDTMTLEERRQMIEIIVEVMRSSNAKTLTQLRGPEGAQNIIPILKAYSGADKEKKKFLMGLIGRFKDIIKNRAVSKAQLLRLNLD